jgi:hypothetical protein
MRFFQDLATENAIFRIGVFWSGPFIANDRTFFNERMEVTSGIDKFALYEAGEMVIYVPNHLDF